MDIKEENIETENFTGLPDNDEDCVETPIYVLKNPQLPSRQTKIRYTPEMIMEIKKCRDDILYFAENYFYIINLDEGKQKIKLYPVQKKALKLMADERRTAIVSSRQMGKCFCHKTLITVNFKPLHIHFKIPVGWFYFIVKTFSRLTTKHKQKL